MNTRHRRLRPRWRILQRQWDVDATLLAALGMAMVFSSNTAETALWGMSLCLPATILYGWWLVRTLTVLVTAAVMVGVYHVTGYTFGGRISTHQLDQQTLDNAFAPTHWAPRGGHGQENAQ